MAEKVMKTEAEWTLEEVVLLPPQLLTDMRYAWEGRMDNESQRRLRQVLDRNPKDFLEQMNGLEKAHQSQIGRQRAAPKDSLSGGNGKEASPPEEKDVGAEKAREMIEKLLGKWGGIHAEA